jgi:hypothetical protein
MNANQTVDPSKHRTIDAPRPPAAFRAPRNGASGRRMKLPVPDEGVAKVMAAVARRIGEQPAAALAAAIALGFVFGGAMSFRAGRVLLSVAARQLGREVIKQLL